METAQPTPTISIAPETFLVIGIFLVVLTGFFVVGRTVVNLRLHKTKLILVEDGIAIFALVFLAANLALTYRTAFGLANAEATSATIRWILQMAIAGSFMAGVSMWSAKVPILMLYVRLFGVNRWLRITSYILIIVTFVVYLGGCIALAVQCAPKPKGTNYFEDPSFIMECGSSASQIGVVVASGAVLADVIIFALPLPVLSHLRLPLAQKVGLFLVFLTGIFAIAASAVNLYFRAALFTNAGKNIDATAASICSVIEASITIIVGCVPATYAFWSNYVARSAIYNKIRFKLGFNSSRGRASAKSRTRTTGNSISLGEVRDRSSQQNIYVTNEFGSQEYYKMNSEDRVTALPATTTETLVIRS
ncbi:hypothetical protein QBC44DRAFT_313981 [Cladorrhinum sp. PSN332]|nr:hypothetical protein QBC44DRAFT_313981 [Cladorrhinum sp. PSN332]